MTADNPPEISKDLLKLVSSVPEYRRTCKGHCRHRLSDMLLLSVLARVSGCRTRKEIVAFGTANLPLLQQCYGILLNGCPSEPTLCRMEMRIDNDAFASLLSEFARGYMDSGAPERRVIAIDGKFMRGTDTGNGRSPDIVTAFSVNDRLPLDTEMCAVKSNEITAAPKIIERAGYIKGAVVTADAMSCQTQIIDAILEKGGDYFIALKANQKAARWSVEDMLPSMTASSQWQSDCELGHGRLHRRSCSVYTDISGMAALEKFSGLRAIVEIRTWTMEKCSRQERTDTRYYITSLDCDAESMDSISRRHWGIENNLHWILDARMGQDATKRKEPATARNLDIIQKIVYTVYAVGAVRHLPYEIKEKKEQMKVRLAAMATRARYDLGYALCLMTM